MSGKTHPSLLLIGRRRQQHAKDGEYPSSVHHQQNRYRSGKQGGCDRGRAKEQNPRERGPSIVTISAAIEKRSIEGKSDRPKSRRIPTLTQSRASAHGYVLLTDTGVESVKLHPARSRCRQRFKTSSLIITVSAIIKDWGTNSSVQKPATSEARKRGRDPAAAATGRHAELLLPGRGLSHPVLD